MEYMLPFIESSQNELILGLIVACILLMILLFITMINLSVFKSNYKKLNKGNTVESYDEYIIKNKTDIADIKNVLRTSSNRMDDLDIKLKRSYAKMTLHKYNAFENQGGKLSFILVLLDEEKNGYILHNIHNNDFSYLYAKNVERGRTIETLTPEEKDVLLETINK